MTTLNKDTPFATLGPVFSTGGLLVTDDKEMATEFNTYFCYVVMRTQCLLQGFPNGYGVQPVKFPARGRCEFAFSQCI